MKNVFIWVCMLTAITTGKAQIFSNHLFIDPLPPTNSGQGNPMSPSNVAGDGGTDATTTGKTRPDIFILGNGSLKDLFTGDGDANTPLSGSVAVSFKTRHTETVIGFTVNTLKEVDVSSPGLFGANMLTPDLSGLSFSLNHMRSFNDTWGFSGFLSLSNSNWRMDTNFVAKANPIVLKLNAVLAPWGSLLNNQTSNNDNYITAYFTAGFSCRALTGNITSQPTREQYLSTNKKFFAGVELGGYLVINNTTAFINVPILSGKNSIDNLTKVQVVIGVAVGGDILKFKRN